MKKFCALMRIEFFFQRNDTKIINFDEGILILWPFFWGNVILKICHFCLKSHNIDVLKISIVWLPRVKCLLLLWKMKTTWIKENHSFPYVTLQRYHPREATQRNSSRPQSWLLIEKQILKMTLPQKNGSRIKTPSSKLLILVSLFCWDFFFFYQLMSSLICPDFFEISDNRCCVLSGPPCIASNIVFYVIYCEVGPWIQTNRKKMTK